MVFKAFTAFVRRSEGLFSFPLAFLLTHSFSQTLVVAIPAPDPGRSTGAVPTLLGAPFGSQLTSNQPHIRALPPLSPSSKATAARDAGSQHILQSAIWNLEPGNSGLSSAGLWEETSAGSLELCTSTGKVLGRG